MLFCDIDRFKPYSDQYGHKVGDQVIPKQIWSATPGVMRLLNVK